MQYDEKLLQDAADFANNLVNVDPDDDDIEQARRALTEGYFVEAHAPTAWEGLVVGYIHGIARDTK